MLSKYHLLIQNHSQGIHKFSGILLKIPLRFIFPFLFNVNPYLGLKGKVQLWWQNVPPVNGISLTKAVVVVRALTKVAPYPVPISGQRNSAHEVRCL